MPHNAIPYHLAAARAQSAMSRVKTNVRCPCCKERVACVVNDNEVTSIADCADTDDCYGPFRLERITDDALTNAAHERSSYATHLRDGGL